MAMFLSGFMDSIKNRGFIGLALLFHYNGINTSGSFDEFMEMIEWNITFDVMDVTLQVGQICGMMAVVGSTS